MICPNCKSTNLNISERSGIEIDYCPDCRGIWLDKGELDKIIERAESYYNDKSSRNKTYSSEEIFNKNEYNYNKGKKRKSIFSEIFDF